MYLLRRMMIVLSLSAAVASPAKAELRLDQWTTYGAMAEQGGVCAAFARIMELQGILDKKTGQLWLERRKFSGAVVRQASVLEGLQPATSEDINELVDRYSLWLLTNLSSDQNAQAIDAAAHNNASQMVAEVCTGLYDRADKAIFERNPGLKICDTPAATQDELSCEIPSKSNENDKRKITELLRNNMSLSKEVNVLQDKIIALQTANPSADNAKDVAGTTSTKPSETITTNAATQDIKTEREVAIQIPTPKPSRGNTAASKATTVTTVSAPPTPAQDTTAQATTVKTTTTGAPKFMAQLGSYRSADSANSGIQTLQTQFPVILAKATLRIAEARLADGQKIYRIVTGAMKRDAATEICTVMWNKKFGCLLKVAR